MGDAHSGIGRISGSGLCRTSKNNGNNCCVSRRTSRGCFRSGRTSLQASGAGFWLYRNEFRALGRCSHDNTRHVLLLEPTSPGAETAGTEGGQSPPRQGGAMRTACSKDMESLCPGLAGIDAAKCLIREHRAQLSTECMTFFKEVRARRNATQSGATQPGGASNSPAPGTSEGGSEH